MSSVDRTGGNGAVIYLGPSVSLEEALRVLPHATYRPPIALGDLLSLVDSESVPNLWAVGIVDGVFYQSLPVWHKEILYVLEWGIEVFGASSMGALRAAECDVFGMVGVGQIYRDFVDGTLTDDDEVALVHSDAGSSWAGRTLPMVNIRATFALAVETRRMSRSAAATLVDAAKGLWFPERTVAGILEAARALGSSEGDRVKAGQVLTDQYVDVKRSDALALLEEIRRRAGGGGSPLVPAEPKRPIGLVRSAMFDSLRQRDRQVDHGGAVLTAEEIARYVSVSHPEYAGLRDRVLDRLAAGELALQWKVEVSPSEIEAEMQRFCARQQLVSEGEVDDWCSRNDMGRRELGELLQQEARGRKVRNWLQMIRTKRILVKPLLDELRLRGEYESWVAKAAALKTSHPYDPNHDLGGDAGNGPDLLKDQMRAGGWRPDLPAVSWAVEAGFSDLADLIGELARHKLERDQKRAALATVVSLFPEEDAG